MIANIQNIRFPVRRVIIIFSVIECRTANARHAVRNRDARQRGAIMERIIANARHAIGNRDARQRGAIIERIIANANRPIRDLISSGNGGLHSN